jgi:hypothetical protein
VGRNIDRELGFKRKSIVAAKCGNEIVAPLMYNGTMDGMLFEFWFENSLVPAIEKDQ